MNNKLTHVTGAPVVDNQNVVTAGPRGPQLLQDVWFLEKLAHFDREVIPERRMHAKGSGAYGTFTVTRDIARYTKAKSPYNPFDLTKVWFHKDYPLIEVGVLELNRNPENYFAEVEQAAFNPASIVPGIGFSPDKMLQGRLFSYGDAQRYRLGVNLHQIPVNAPRTPAHSFHRDGTMRIDENYGSTLGYEPNSYGEWKEQPEFSEPPLALEGAAAHWDHRTDEDYYSQPGKLFRLMNAAQGKALFENTAAALGDAPREIKIRHIGNCLKADSAYGKGVADALGIPMSEAAGKA